MIELFTFFAIFGVCTRAMGVGGYKPVTDLTTLEPIAIFVTRSVAQSNNDFLLGQTKIVSGEMQVVAGYNYKITLEYPVTGTVSGISAPPSIEYTAEVFVDLQGQRHLIKLEKVSKTQKPKCIPGGYCDHIVDASVEEAAKFGLAQMDSQSGLQVTLTKILSCQTQVVAGVNYKIKMQLTDQNGQSAVFTVIVLKDLKNTYHLSDFSQSTAAAENGVYLGPGPVIGGTGLGNLNPPGNTALGGWSAADMTDSATADRARMASLFAFHEISKSINTKLTYVGFTNVEQQVVNGINIKLRLKCTTLGNLETGFETVVHLPPGSNKFKMVEFTQYIVDDDRVTGGRP